MAEVIYSLVLELYWNGKRRKFGGKDDKLGESKLITGGYREQH